ncbi:MAG: RNA polymerase subunit sigma [Planctomycetota bacterium]|nr:MAG: RNA polymerase subunit sigma [Planctomycetota bacterium]
MDTGRRATATVLLAAVRAGDRAARERLVALVYDELRPLAGGLMGAERPGHTLQPTALVHEALIRLFDEEALHTIENRNHFLNAAAQAMRRILVDHARAKTTHKRGGNARRVPLDDVLAVFEESGIDVLDLNDALVELAASDPRGHEFIQLHYFAGLTQAQITELSGLSHTTVENDLREAKRWLRARLSGEHNHGRRTAD